MAEFSSPAKQERKLLRKQYSELFDHLCLILYKRDPIGIAEGNPHWDEYSSEVGAILPRLKEASSAIDLRSIIYQEFLRWFEDSLTTGDENRYEEIAQDIWQLWQDYQTEHPDVKL